MLLIAWIARTLTDQQRHINAISYIQVGTFWTVSLKYITPVLLGFMIVYGAVQELQENYGGYPGSGLLFVGVGSVLVTLAFSLALSLNSRAAARRDLAPPGPGEGVSMSTEAIITLVVAATLLWGGLLLAILNYVRASARRAAGPERLSRGRAQSSSPGAPPARCRRPSPRSDSTNPG